MTERKIYKPKSISGFPEWLPEYRSVEQQWMDHFRRVFESYGYTNIDTPAVEELGVLAAKGEVDKEIYVLERLHKDDNDKSDARLALHFDQTVPMARYVAQHFADLNFPFKRYQMQKVWRGERPQLGRLREFYQCDIDVIGIDNLPLHFDAEMPAVMYEALSGLDIGRVQIRISNRKLFLGFLEANNLNDENTNLLIIRQFDKADKYPDTMDDEQVFGALFFDFTHSLKEIPNSNLYGWTNLEPILKSFFSLTRRKYRNSSELKEAIEGLEYFDFRNSKIQSGFEELSFVADNLQHILNKDGSPGVVIDLSIFRGLDYYTGTVYESRLLDVPEFTGSVCSGGRYDDLAGSYINKHLPGVGISIGLSRLFDVLKAKGKIAPGRKCPTDILVVLPSEDMRASAAQTAATLRTRGYNVELFHKAAKTGDQITYANKKGIPYVWLPPFNPGEPHKVKTLATGDQTENVDANIWKPGN